MLRVVEKRKVEQGMKRFLAILLAVLMLLSCAALAEQAEGLQQDVVVLFTSDVHCGIDQGFG